MGLGKAHLELVAACNNFKKIFVVHNFLWFSQIREKREKLSSSKLRAIRYELCWHNLGYEFEDYEEVLATSTLLSAEL